MKLLNTTIVPAGDENTALANLRQAMAQRGTLFLLIFEPGTTPTPSIQNADYFSAEKQGNYTRHVIWIQGLSEAVRQSLAQINPRLLNIYAVSLGENHALGKIFAYKEPLEFQQINLAYLDAAKVSGEYHTSL